MAINRREKNAQWLVRNEQGGFYNEHGASLAVLMDIRDELQTLNRLLGCSNFTNIPTVLCSIRRNTAKPRQKRKAKAA